jgi:hypothetical protein
LKAWESKRYHIVDSVPRPDVKVSLPPDWTLARMEYWAAEDERVANAFEGYEHYKRVEYADLFPDATGAVGEAALHDLAGWFGVSDAFTNRASFLKLSSLPLDQTIENIDELRAAFQGTRFERYLEDEPAYRQPPPSR